MATGLTLDGATAPTRGTLKDYLALARFDHATKHVFILPGIILAYVLRQPPLEALPLMLMLGFASAVLIASANYVINEWLDREFDIHHPTKSLRPAVQRQLSPALVYGEYAALAVGGLLLAWFVGLLFFATSVVFLLSGVIYNIRPMRSKDRPFIDVLTESLNNPIRLILGWTMIDAISMPPSSLLLSYWMGGAFLMACKRLSEYRDIVNAGQLDSLKRYRASFRAYTAESLTVSCLLYAILSAFFIAVFLIKYRIEYLLGFPFIAVLFAVYLWLSLRPQSVAQRPERLFRSRRLMTAVITTVLVLIITSFADLPWLQTLSEPQYMSVEAGSGRP